MQPLFLLLPMVPVKDKGIAAAVAALPPEERPQGGDSAPCTPRAGDGEAANSDAESVSPKEEIPAVSKDKSGDGLRQPLLDK